MKKTFIAGCAGAALLCLSNAHAENYYVGVGVAAVPFKFDGPGFDQGSDGRKADAKLFAGYTFDQNWGVELGYVNFRTAAHQSDTVVPGSKAHQYVSNRGSSLYAAAKARVALGAQLSAYGKLGLARNHYRYDANISINAEHHATHGSENRTGVYAALGLQYQVLPNVGLGLEFEHLGKSSQVYGVKSNAVSANLSYAF
ncbi:porin family protein [Rugamonas rubra]|uniref:OmpA-OmpF porin, OOP family n=1 Tax=Rugamonas rubra TaxID=758825 RepID=A0A1I4HLL7_9BURK|nr:porin family protein [Rugamonas rubra]SFL43129.1 OmpA-OmpF porin, OOP family [Rugamonas rubra]